MFHYYSFWFGRDIKLRAFRIPFTTLFVVSTHSLHTLEYECFKAGFDYLKLREGRKNIGAPQGTA